MCAKRLGTQGAESKASRWTWRIVIFLGSLAFLFLAVICALLFYIPTVIYQPVHSSAPEDVRIAVLHDISKAPGALSYRAPKIISLKAPDGTKIRAYWLEHPDAQKSPTKLATLLYLHGNMGDLYYCFDSVKGWIQHTPVNGLIVSYRGYGYSSGKPTMKGIQMDSQTALDYLISRPDVDSSKIIVHGHSLGGAVALNLVSKNPQHALGLVVENTFLSIPKMATHTKPYLAWATFLVTDTWDNEEHLAVLKQLASRKDARFPHILFLAGSKDHIVPPEHMDKLWESAKEIGQIRGDCILERVIFPECTHDCRTENNYYPELATFFEKITGQTLPPSSATPAAGKLNQLKSK